MHAAAAAPSTICLLLAVLDVRRSTVSSFQFLLFTVYFSALMVAFSFNQIILACCWHLLVSLLWLSKISVLCMGEPVLIFSYGPFSLEIMYLGLGEPKLIFKLFTVFGLLEGPCESMFLKFGSLDLGKSDQTFVISMVEDSSVWQKSIWWTALKNWIDVICIHIFLEFCFKFCGMGWVVVYCRRQRKWRGAYDGVLLLSLICFSLTCMLDYSIISLGSGVGCVRFFGVYTIDRTWFPPMTLSLVCPLSRPPLRWGFARFRVHGDEMDGELWGYGDYPSVLPIRTCFGGIKICFTPESPVDTLAVRLVGIIAFWILVVLAPVRLDIDVSFRAGALLLALSLMDSYSSISLIFTVFDNCSFCTSRSIVFFIFRFSRIVIEF